MELVTLKKELQNLGALDKDALVIGGLLSLSIHFSASEIFCSPKAHYSQAALVA